MNEKIKVAIVDDDSAFRFILLHHLSKLEDIVVIHEFSNGMELIDGLKLQLPDIVLLDLEMPVMDGIETTKYLSKYYSNVKKIVMTIHDGEEISINLIEKGVNGFLPKESGLNQIVDAIYNVVVKKQDYFVGKDLKNLILFKAAKSEFVLELKLSDRELQILGLVCNGETSQEIAKKLFISKRTVEVHRTNVFQKTKTKNVGHLAKFALHHGLIKYDDGNK